LYSEVIQNDKHPTLNCAPCHEDVHEAPHILDVCIRWKWVAIFTHINHFTSWESLQYTLNRTQGGFRISWQWTKLLLGTKPRPLKLPNELSFFYKRYKICVCKCMQYVIPILYCAAFSFFKIASLKLQCSIHFRHKYNSFIHEVTYANLSQLLAQRRSPTHVAELG
jgi:hypothetical protein